MPKACLKACAEEDSCPQDRSTKTVHKAPCCKEVARFEHLKTEQATTAPTSHVNPVVSDLPGFTQVTTLLAVLFHGSEPAIRPQQPDDPLFRSGRFRLITLCSWLI